MATTALSGSVMFQRWVIIATAALLVLVNPVSSQDVTVTKEQCDELYASEETVVASGCNKTACEINGDCTLHGSTYLEGKCCAHSGVNVNLLAFEKAPEWEPRLKEYKRCTGANVLLTYVEGGEDSMAGAILDDVGSNDDPTSGQGIYDAYIVQGPWVPQVHEGLLALNDLIKANQDVIRFDDINSASRNAVTYGGEVVALPLDSDNIAIGYRQDLMNKYAKWYQDTFGEELKAPNTVEEMLTISERINGLNHTDDGEAGWGFCLTPQTNYFQAFLAPIMTVNQFDEGGSTGQNIFFDTNNFQPLIHNEGFKLGVKNYWRFILASNCQTQTPEGVKCDRKTAFPTGRCFGVTSMPGTMTNMLKEGGKYAPPADKRQDKYLKPNEYWGRRIQYPGSTDVTNWDVAGYPLMKCDSLENCPSATIIDDKIVNFSPFFAEGGEAYAINGKQSKEAARQGAWDLMAWFSQLSPDLVPLAGLYRKSQLKPEATAALAEIWNSTVMAEDLNKVLSRYFREPEDGGNPTQDLFIVGFADYNDALDTSLHKEFLLASIEDGGLMNMTDPRNSIKVDTPEFDKRYDIFIQKLQQRYDEVNARMTGGALQQLYNWRNALSMEPKLTKTEICSNLLAEGDYTSFDNLDCIKQVDLNELCQFMKEDVEAYQPGACAGPNNNAKIIAAVFGSVIGAIVVGGLAYLVYNRYVSYLRIRKAHDQLMEATINESIRALHQLDYPLHLVRGDEFVAEEKLMRHEVLRNTHKLTVLDSLPDVDAFIAAGKHIVFFSHQWTSFNLPDPSNKQYEAMCVALRELAKSNGWDESLKDIFIWVDYSCIPQANPSTQTLAIRSLAAYASSATYFIIVAPDTKHADMDDQCDIATYQLRMWCRAEQVCHSMRNGTEGMYLAIGIGSGSDLVPVNNDFFQESLHVFDGQLTCCRLEHKGMSACDRQSLVVPLLGLYGELYRAAVEGVKNGNAESLASVKAFLDEIEKHQESVFPRTFQRVMWRKNKKVTEEVLLFGDLIERMKFRIDNGQGFSYEEDANGSGGTASMKSSDKSFIRHGASDFLRHGSVVMRHGSTPTVQLETAVGNLEDHIEK